MKRPLSRSFLRLLTVTLLFVAAYAVEAQPQWRFHLAFEDGTGAQDTIWLVYDTTATLPTDPFPGPNVDTTLGEAGINLDTGQFNVWVRNALWDSTKTFAMPYAWYPVLNVPSIEAMNWVPPMTIHWDTSLFRAPFLPGPDTFGLAVLDGTYFFFNNNHPELHAFDMLLTDHVVVDVDADLLFPFGVYFGQDETGIAEIGMDELQLGPNPAVDRVSWKTLDAMLQVDLFDQVGRKVAGAAWQPPSNTLDLSNLPDGLYLLNFLTANHQHIHARIVKQTRL